jgi:hypothetical protein
MLKKVAKNVKQKCVFEKMPKKKSLNIRKVAQSGHPAFVPCGQTHFAFWMVSS